MIGALKRRVREGGEEEHLAKTLMGVMKFGREDLFVRQPQALVLLDLIMAEVDI